MTTTKTLLEQLQITEYEIERRKNLLGFSEQDINALVSHKPLIEENVDSIVANFYKKQTSIDEISLLIGDADTLKRLHSSQRAYVLNLFEGYYDIEYVNNRLRIGVVHKRIGVEPKLYLAAVSELKGCIHLVLREQIGDIDTRIQVMEALDKLFYFDTTLVFDTYIRGLLTEVESAKNKVLNYAKELEFKIEERTRELQELSQRDVLTGLYNQRALRDFLRRDLLLAKRHRKEISLIYLDIDNFKAINDTNGHMEGDEVLKMVAQAMKSVCRETDVPCRNGGDEFCMTLLDCGKENAVEICNRMIRIFSDFSPNVTFSMGVAQTGPTEFMEADQLLRAADEKMYEAKLFPGFKICS